MKKLTLEELQAIAAAKGGACTSGVYLGSAAMKHGWRCSAGHEWEASAASVKTGSWCSLCHVNANRGTLDDLKTLAQKRGGDCISEFYGGSRLAKHIWKCARGHQWDASAASIIRGSWCPKCAASTINSAKRLKLVDLQKMAEAKKGKCVSKEYLGSVDVKHRWECDRGHGWEASPAKIRQGRWCPVCARESTRHTLDDLVAVAHAKGGECLTKQYLGSSEARCLWRCEQGHEWDTTAKRVLSGNWCKICANEKRALGQRKNLEWLNTLAVQGGGVCLSTGYEGHKAKHRFRCAEGHEWDTSPRQVVLGAWCPQCARAKAGLSRRGKQKGPSPSRNLKDQAIEYAAKKGGALISLDWVGGQSKCEWTCAAGHEWKSSLDALRAGSWCRKCASEKARLSVEQLREDAKESGGELLSPVSMGSTVKHDWKCSRGHVFKMSPACVRQGHWCPCCPYKGEMFAREALQELEGVAFPKSRPSWLMWKNGRALELDGYCEALGVAFEYHGRQHFEMARHWNKGEADLLDQRERDEFKRRACAENGVLLLEIEEIKKPTLKKLRGLIMALSEEKCLPLRANPQFASMMSDWDGAA